jgi:hypothetical protein
MDADQIKLIEVSRGAHGLAAFLLGYCMASHGQNQAAKLVDHSNAAGRARGKGTMPAVD